MSKLDIAKFLFSAFNMVKRGEIKSEQDLIKFAKQQFGDLDSGLLGQIKDVFTKGKAAAVTETRTKDIMRGDPTGEKKEGLISLWSVENQKKRNFEAGNNFVKWERRKDKKKFERFYYIYNKEMVIEYIKCVKGLIQILDIYNEMGNWVIHFKKI